MNIKLPLLTLSFLISGSLFATAAYADPTLLEVKYKTIEVNGKSAQVYTIIQPDGTWGYTGTEGDDFNVIVKNEIKAATVVHWHGLILPNNQDGTPVTQALIPPGGEYHYHFKLVQAGTYWMHSHEGLQTQDLLEAPLIINDPHDPYKADQQVVVMFQDFSFQSPTAVFKSLQSAAAKPSTAPAKSGPDLNDVNYDAFLTNYHTLQNPQVVAVKPGSTVRLRFIDGGSGSNFWIKLGKLTGEAIAFDGENIHPFFDTTFQLAIAQRIDVLVKIPESGGTFPILGQVEGTKRQTGLILATPNAKIPHEPETVDTAEPPLNYQQELRMKAEHPLAIKPIQRVITLNLTGNMQKYIWMINGQAWPNIKPIQIKEGERVELIFNNESGMAHPMHLHGHFFELVGIDQKTITDGALHDTFLVLPHTQVKVIFDADYPGKWLLHCHTGYHQASGMMTIVEIGKEFKA